MPVDLPDGWERVEEVSYTKFIKRDAVTVPKRHREGSAFQRDAVVLVTGDCAGVVKGPGARQTWTVDDAAAVGARLAAVIDEWVAEDGDPYGGAALDEHLDAAAAEPADAPVQLREGERRDDAHAAAVEAQLRLAREEGDLPE